MPFTNSPTYDTYKTDRVSLFREIALRDGGASGKDEDYLNCFVETVKQSKAEDSRKFIVKRTGTDIYLNSVSPSTIRGMHFWEEENKLLYCVGRNVYVYNVVTAASATLTNVFSTSTGEVGFAEFLYETGDTKVIASDGNAVNGLVSIDSANVVVTSTDTDLPAHEPHIIFLDGYIFLVETSTGKIFNSELDLPLSYTVDAFIVPEQDSDTTRRITKINNYLVAFGSRSIEYYWDAANAAPDSPMQRNDSPVKYNGYLGGLAHYGNSVFFLGRDLTGQPDVFKLADFKIENIGSPSISRYLNLSNMNISQWKGNIVSIQGHTFYIITVGTNKTWAIDLEEQLITRFSYQNLPIFDIKHTAVIKTLTGVKTLFCLDSGESTLHKFDETIFQDHGINYPVVFTTENNDFKTLNRKFMGRLGFICDRPTVDSFLGVQWSDDDYNTWTTIRYVNLNVDIPFIRQLGHFRSRVFKCTYEDNLPLRVQDMEVEINKGSA